MNIQGGYTGNLLRIDLTSERVDIEPLAAHLITHFLGGAGINAALAYSELIPKQDPFDPANRMIFGLGPLVGTMIPGAGKGNVTARSPYKQFLGMSGHGRFGMLKFAGFDHLIIAGRSAKPVVLCIDNDQVTLIEADDLWGRDVFDTTDRLWQRLGSRFDITCIGPAGENRVWDAGLITNKYAAFARTGMGAVMGSKNLKAIAVCGSGGVQVADRPGFLKAANRIFKTVRADPNLLQWRKYGTLISLDVFSRMGLYAGRNYQLGFDEGLQRQFPLDEFILQLKKGDVACQACPVGCKHHLAFGASGEPETRLTVSCLNAVIQSFGTFCMVTDWKEAVRCAESAVRMGLDFMSTGNLVAFAMELYQRGIITDTDNDGQPLSWGDGKAVRDLIGRIARRQGLGAVLAQGLPAAAQHFGAPAQPYAMHTKGLGLLYDPRVRLESTEIFSQFTNARGHISNVSVTMVERTPEQIRRYCHKIGLTPEAIERVVDDQGYNVGRLNKWTEDVTAVLELLGICQFPPFQRLSLDLWAQAYTAATGISTGPQDLIRAAENMWHIRRAYNLREGATHRDDTCPDRFMRESIQVGKTIHAPVDESRFRSLVSAYYDERGWDPITGTPSRQRLAEIGVVQV